MGESMSQTDIHNLKSKLNEIFSLVVQLKEILNRYERCKDSLKECERYVDMLEEIIVKLLRGEVHDLHIELSIGKIFTLRADAECLPSYFYKVEDTVDLICIWSTTLGKLLIYTAYDAVLNPSEETVRRIVEEKVKPKLQERALEWIKEKLHRENTETKV